MPVKKVKEGLIENKETIKKYIYEVIREMQEKKRKSQ